MKEDSMTIYPQRLTERPPQLPNRPRPHCWSRGSWPTSVREDSCSDRQILGTSSAGRLGQGRELAGSAKRGRGPSV